VIWFKTQYTRHICLVNDDCKLGYELNPWVFSLLRYWLKAVFVPVNRSLSVLDNILNFSTVKLSFYFKTELILKLQDTEDKLIKKIKVIYLFNSLLTPSAPNTCISRNYALPSPPPITTIYKFNSIDWSYFTRKYKNLIDFYWL